MLHSGLRLNGEDGRWGGAAAAVQLHVHVEREPVVGYAQSLGRVRAALRSGDLEAAEHELMRAAAIGEGEAAFHNLLGVLHECRGRVRQARRCYGRATKASGGRYWPAQLNLRRLYELDAFGRTDKVASVGDEHA